ncbi:MAG: hypothetical protein AAF268_00430 [Cyanobacteria bacterium P01_A01_bin.3]
MWTKQKHVRNTVSDGVTGMYGDARFVEPVNCLVLEMVGLEAPWIGG